MNGFGSMLNDYLEYHKMSQTDFADQLNISHKQMNEILNGKADLSIELMISISLLTNIDINLIYYVENKKKVYQELMDKYKSEKNINRILSKFNLDEMEKQGLLRLKDKTSFVQNYLDLTEFLKIKDLETFDNYLMMINNNS